MSSLALSGCRSSTPTAGFDPNAPLDAAHRAADVQAFDEVWAKVDNTYFNPARLAGGEGNVDWAALRTQIRPRVEHARTHAEARDAIQDLLDALGETHFALLPAEQFDDANHPTSTGGDIGITPRVIDGQAVVWRIQPGSPAARAGVRPGWIISRVDGRDVASLLRPPATTRPATRPAASRAQQVARSLLMGDPNEATHITFIDGSGRSRSLRLNPRPADVSVAALGNVPTMSLRFESRSLGNGIGYFSLSSFLDPPSVMPAFETFMRAHNNAPGIVIDLRDNAGGLSGMATGMAGFFIERDDASLGTMVMREGHLNLAINPRLPTYSGKVAILVDPLTASTSEIFAAGLRDLGRARLFGETTAGAALPSLVARLSNGDRLQYAVADFQRTNGARLEGAGVVPDERVRLSRSDLLNRRDATLEAAVRWIRSGAATAPSATAPGLPTTR